MTDFENAAFALFVVLLSRAILSFNLNLYIPISKVDENMGRAQQRDASVSGRFYFRKDVFPPNQSMSTSSVSSCSSLNSNSPVNGTPGQKEKKLRNCYPSLPLPENGVHHGSVDDEYEEMSMNEIMNGKGNAFPGLLSLVYAFLDTLDVAEDQRQKIAKYLDLIRRRSNGSLQTPATWIRNFVRSHPAYKFDSVVNEEINYDLMIAVDEIERGVRKAEELLPIDYTGGDADQGSIGM